MGYILNHKQGLKFNVVNVGSTGAPVFNIQWTRITIDKEGDQYNSQSLYLQRSYTASNFPALANNGATPAYVVSRTTPIVESAWTTIKSWNAAETAALVQSGYPLPGHVIWTPGNDTPPQGQSNYNYRLIYFVTEVSSGDTYEIDYAPVVIAVGGSPGSVVWVKSFGGVRNDFATSVALGSDGSIYITGLFTGQADFGNGITLSTTPADNQIICVAKYSASGTTCLWAKSYAYAQAAKAVICVDPTDNILISAPFTDGMVKKLNPANGATLWTKGPVPTGFQFTQQKIYVNSIASDSQGNAIVTGAFVAVGTNPMDFGNGSPLSSNSGSLDMFLAKYASANGACSWAQTFVNYGDTEYGMGVVVDTRVNPSTGLPYDQIILAGYSVAGISIGGIVLGNFTSQNQHAGTSGFIAKLDSSGNLIGSLAKSCGVNDFNGNSGFSRVQGVAMDRNGDIIVCGGWAGHQTWGGPVRYNPAQGASGYLAKFSGSTLAYLWDSETASPRSAEIFSVATDSIRNIFACGYFYNTTNFGSGYVLTPPAPLVGDVASDAFVMKVSPTGVTTWAIQLGGNQIDAGNGIVVSGQNQPIAVGSFMNNLDGTAAPFGSTTLTSYGLTDGFITKLNP